MPYRGLCAVGSSARRAFRFGRELVAHPVAELLHFVRDRTARLFAAGWCEQHTYANSHAHADQQSCNCVDAAMIFPADHLHRPPRSPRCLAVSVTRAVAYLVNAFTKPAPE